MNASANIQKAQTAQFKAQTDAQLNQDKLTVDKMKIAGEQQVAQQQVERESIIHAGDAAKAAGEAARANRQMNMDAAHQDRQHGLAVQQHGLNVAQAHHDAAMDMADHALQTHIALNPPEPSGGNS
jgi:hypothetical protein